MKQYNNSLKGKLFKYFSDKLKIKQSTKGWQRCNCPYCGAIYTFGINVEKNKAHCFRCETTETPLQTVMNLEGFTENIQALNFLKIQQEYEAYDGMADREIFEKKDVLLPEGFIPINYADGIMGKAAQNYMVNTRKFRLSELTMAGVGYCLTGEYAGYIIFPFYAQGKLIFFQGRKFAGHGPKMKNPKNEDFGIGKSELIYNQDALFAYRVIDIVESITNALTLGEKAVAILGKSISPYQWSMIMGSPCECVNLLLDSDAYAKSLNLALRMCQLKRVKLIKMPEEKDVNNLGRQITKEMIRKTPYQEWMDLNRLRLNIDNEGPVNTYNRVLPKYYLARVNGQRQIS